MRKSSARMLAPGGQAPDFTLPVPGGKTIALADMTASGPVLLAFFKTSCPVCQYTFPFLNRLTAAQGLKIAGISQDNVEKTLDFCRTFGVSFPTAFDEAGQGYAVSNAYGITNVPSLFLVEDTIVTQAVSGFSRIDLERIGQRFGVPIFHAGEKVPDFRPG